MSQLLQWHVENKSMYGLVRHVVYNKTWEHINSTWLDFAIEPRNLRLVIPWMDLTHSQRSYANG
jgi:hypothetical protein